MTKLRVATQPPEDKTKFEIWVIRRKHDGAVFPPVSGQGKGGSFTEPKLGAFPRIFTSYNNACIFLGQWCKGRWVKKNEPDGSCFAEPVFVEGRNFDDFDVVPYVALDPDRMQALEGMVSACQNLAKQYEGGAVDLKYIYLEAAFAVQRWSALDAYGRREREDIQNPVRDGGDKVSSQ